MALLGRVGRGRWWILLLIGAGLMVLSPPAFSQLSPEQRREMSIMMLKEVARTGGSLVDLPPSDRLNVVFARVARLAKRKDITYRVQLLQGNPDFQAWVCPDGTAVVCEGVLQAFASSDDALAFVLAHEITHVEKKHLEQIRQSAGLTDFLVNTAAGAVPGGRGVGGAVVAITSQVMAQMVKKSLATGFSREAETDADKCALAMAIEAGFDPSGSLLVPLFIEAAEARDKKPAYRNHPLPRDRYKNLVRWLGEKKIAVKEPGPVTLPAFVATRAGGGGTPGAGASPSPGALGMRDRDMVRVSGPGSPGVAGMPQGAGAPVGVVTTPDERPQDRRYLVVENRTPYVLKLKLSYYTVTERSTWEWFRDRVFEIGPNRREQLLDDGWKVNASAIRFTATAEGLVWSDYQDRPLDLGGAYRAASMREYVLTFEK